MSVSSIFSKLSKGDIGGAVLDTVTTSVGGVGGLLEGAGNILGFKDENDLESSLDKIEGSLLNMTGEIKPTPEAVKFAKETLIELGYGKRDSVPSGNPELGGYIILANGKYDNDTVHALNRFAFDKGNMENDGSGADKFMNTVKNASTALTFKSPTYENLSIIKNTESGIPADVFQALIDEARDPNIFNKNPILDSNNPERLADLGDALTSGVPNNGNQNNQNLHTEALRLSGFHNALDNKTSMKLDTPNEGAIGANIFDTSSGSKVPTEELTVTIKPEAGIETPGQLA